MSTELALPPQVAQEANSIVSRANAVIVKGNEDMATAGELLRAIKTVRNNIDATFDGPIKAAHAAHKAMLAAKSKHDAPLATAEMIVKRRISEYTTEQERIRRAEEARLREIARKQEEERQLAEAAALEAAGEREAAEAVVSAPVQAPVVVLPKAVAAVEGIKTRKSWKFRIADARQIPRDYLLPDEKKIGQVVRAMGESCRIPGIEVYSEDVVSACGF